MKKSQKNKIIKEWIINNGAAGFDLKKRDIILYDGGIICIEKKQVKRHKIIGRKKYPNGITEILFSKKRCVKATEYYATFWFEDLDDTIAYFKRMKKMLNKIVYKTSLNKKTLKQLTKLGNSSK